jgi:hypothetical protein
MGLPGLLLSPAKKPSSDIPLSKIILLIFFICLWNVSGSLLK